VPPQLRAVGGPHQLDVDRQAVAEFAQLADDQLDGELAAGRVRVESFPAVAKDRAARQDSQVPSLRQRVGDLLGDPGRDVVAVRGA
jgi:hypothetical protein